VAAPGVETWASLVGATTGEYPSPLVRNAAAAAVPEVFPGRSRGPGGVETARGWVLGEALTTFLRAFPCRSRSAPQHPPQVAPTPPPPPNPPPPDRPPHPSHPPAWPPAFQNAHRRLAAARCPAFPATPLPRIPHTTTRPRAGWLRPGLLPQTAERPPGAETIRRWAWRLPPSRVRPPSARRQALPARFAAPRSGGQFSFSARLPRVSRSLIPTPSGNLKELNVLVARTPPSAADLSVRSTLGARFAGFGERPGSAGRAALKKRTDHSATPLLSSRHPGRSRTPPRPNRGRCTLSPPSPPHPPWRRRRSGRAPSGGSVLRLPSSPPPTRSPPTHPSPPPPKPRSHPRLAAEPPHPEPLPRPIPPTQPPNRTASGPTCHLYDGPPARTRRRRSPTPPSTAPSGPCSKTISVSRGRWLHATATGGDRPGAMRRALLAQSHGPLSNRAQKPVSRSRRSPPPPPGHQRVGGSPSNADERVELTSLAERDPRRASPRPVPVETIDGFSPSHLSTGLVPGRWVGTHGAGKSWAGRSGWCGRAPPRPSGAANRCRTKTAPVVAVPHRAACGPPILSTTRTERPCGTILRTVAKLDGGCRRTRSPVGPPGRRRGRFPVFEPAWRFRVRGLPCPEAGFRGGALHGILRWPRPNAFLPLSSCAWSPVWAFPRSPPPPTTTSHQPWETSHTPRVVSVVALATERPGFPLTLRPAPSPSPPEPALSSPPPHPKRPHRITALVPPPPPPPRNRPTRPALCPLAWSRTNAPIPPPQHGHRSGARRSPVGFTSFPHTPETAERGPSLSAAGSERPSAAAAARGDVLVFPETPCPPLAPRPAQHSRLPVRTAHFIHPPPPPPPHPPRRLPPPPPPSPPLARRISASVCSRFSDYTQTPPQLWHTVVRQRFESWRTSSLSTSPFGRLAGSSTAMRPHPVRLGAVTPSLAVPARRVSSEAAPAFRRARTSSTGDDLILCSSRRPAAHTGLAGTIQRAAAPRLHGKGNVHPSPPTHPPPHPSARTQHGFGPGR